MQETSENLKHRVLIVDESRSCTDLLKDVIPANGFGRPLILDPVTALFSVDSAKYEIAFIDSKSPGALDLGRKIISARPGAGVVIFGDEDSVRPMLYDGSADKFDFLLNPVTGTDVLLALKRLGQKRRLIDCRADAEMRYTYFIENMPLLIFRIKDDYSLSFMNRACRSMLGFDPQKAAMEPGWFLNRVHDEDRDSVTKSLERAFKGFAPITLQCRMMHSNGYVVYGILKTLPCEGRLDLCEANSVDCIFMDISERVQLENYMLQDERLKTVGAISSEVAHEIRNPLVSIGGFARRLSAKAPGIPETDIILKESKRLEELLDRIRSYLDPVKLESRPCSLNEILVETIDQVYLDLENLGLTIKTSLDDRLPQAEADPAALTRIFANLIRGAIQGLKPGGSIRVATYLNGGTVNASFTNRLADLMPLDADSMYSPFKANNFGLPMAHRLLQSMGGHMTLSRDKKSALFIVAVPQYRPAEEQKSLFRTNTPFNVL